MLCRWTIAYSRSLMCHLRPGENLEVRPRPPPAGRPRAPPPPPQPQAPALRLFCAMHGRRSKRLRIILNVASPPVCTFCRACCSIPRPDELQCPRLPLQAELKDTLPPHELKALLASTHRPNYVVQVGGQRGAGSREAEFEWGENQTCQEGRTRMRARRVPPRGHTPAASAAPARCFFVDPSWAGHS